MSSNSHHSSSNSKGRSISSESNSKRKPPTFPCPLKGIHQTEKKKEQPNMMSRSGSNTYVESKSNILQLTPNSQSEVGSPSDSWAKHKSKLPVTDGKNSGSKSSGKPSKSPCRSTSKSTKIRRRSSATDVAGTSFPRQKCYCCQFCRVGYTSKTCLEKHIQKHHQ